MLIPGGQEVPFPSGYELYLILRREPCVCVFHHCQISESIHQSKHVGGYQGWSLQDLTLVPKRSNFTCCPQGRCRCGAGSPAAFYVHRLAAPGLPSTTTPGFATRTAFGHGPVYRLHRFMTTGRVFYAKTHQTSATLARKTCPS